MPFRSRGRRRGRNSPSPGPQGRIERRQIPLEMRRGSRHDRQHPPDPSRVHRRGVGHRPAPAARARGRGRHRGRDGQIRRAGVPRPGHHRRAADGLQPQFRHDRARRRGSNITKPEERRLGLDMADVSNLDRDSRPFARDDRRRMFNLGNRLWHSDSSFRAVPAKYSLLSGRVIPASGGNTEFADMRAAYDALDDATKAEIEDLVCEHSLIYSRGLLGFTELTDEEKAELQAGAPAPGAPPSGHRAQVAVPVFPCRRRSWAGRVPEARACSARPDGARDPARSSSTPTTGGCTTSSSGTTARPCTASAASTTRATFATCAERRSAATR